MDIPLFCPKKWESKKNRPLTAGKRPDAEPCKSSPKESFLVLPPLYTDMNKALVETLDKERKKSRMGHNTRRRLLSLFEWTWAV